MAGVLPEEACVVNIMHMVNPATFWVSEPSGQDMTSERGELQALEETLQTHCRHASFYRQECFMPEPQEMVAVEHPQTHRWHRGRVEEVLNLASGFMYKVFLVDHGVPLQVRNCSIQELPGSYKSLGYQAVQLVLYGVLPVTLQLEYTSTSTKTMVLDHWTAAAIRYVKGMLEKCVQAYVVYHTNTKNVVYGDLYLELDNSIVNLKKELCDNKYAIFNEKVFGKGCEKTEKSNMSALLSDDGASRSISPKQAERRNIREYLSEYNERKKKMKERTQREEQAENDEEEIPLGRGISIRRRPEVSPGGLMQTILDPSSDLSLLGMLDMMSDIAEPPPKSKSSQERQISYVPAGSRPSDIPKSSRSRKPTSLSQNVTDDGKTYRLSGNSGFTRKTIYNKIPQVSVKETSDSQFMSKTSDSKEVTDVPEQHGSKMSPTKSKVDNNCELVRQTNDNDKVTERSEVVSARPVSLLERLQERTKKNNNKQEGMMQKIMDGVVKTPQAKLKVAEKKSGDKSALGLPLDYKLKDRSSTARLLVHGDMRSHPIQSVEDANFPPEIHKALGKMDFKSPMRMQMYAWPAIMRGQYTVLVGPSRSGKTMSYVVPIVSFMLTPDMYSELPPGNGPLVLVLCSGSRNAEFVYEKCCLILELARRTDIRVQVALGGDCEVDLRDQLANGCDILISTPRCFLRLLRCSHLITNLDRLAHLVIEQVDILAKNFLPEVKKILAECKQVLRQRAKLGVPIQLIAASEKWCPAVEQFSQHVSQDFVICISGHLEAAVYAKLRPTLHYINAVNKVQTLLDVLDGVRGLYKTVVVCRDAQEVDMLEPILRTQCFYALMAHDEKTLGQIREVHQRWRTCVSGSYPVLVCCDDVLPELEINDAMWLIHYSLPVTKTKFGFRFSSLMNNYTSVFHKSPASGEDPDCTVHIFLDKDNDNKQLPEVVQFMKRLSVPVHPELKNRAAVIIAEQESQKTAAPLCYNIKAFGECVDKKTCGNRHIVLSPQDEPVNIPRRGQVKLKILHVLDASRFAARLLQFRNNDGRTVNVSDDYFVINMAVLKHFSDEKNKRLHGLPKLGDICGLEHKISRIQRVQVVEITKQDEKSVPEEVRVYFMDEGIYKEVKVYQLLSLPAHLQRLQPQTVEVFLCNLVPCDLDTCWSAKATYRMSSWIRTITAGETEGKFVMGKIVLSLGNTLWLDPLKCCSHLDSLDTLVTEVSLRMELLKSRLAVENPRHMIALLEMCRQAKIEFSQDEKKVVTQKEVPVTPQWAHLPRDDYQAVEFVYATHPHEFFVRRCDSDKSFQELVSEIQDYVKTKRKDFQVEKGSLCIGKFPEDGVWYRARVEDLLEDNLVSLFFVDHGDLATVSTGDIAAIDNRFITKLPFQAIECSLAGVKPAQGDAWCEDSIDLLYEILDSCNIHVKVSDVLGKGRCTGGKKYEVLCVDTSTEQDVFLNRVLVDRNLAFTDDLDQLTDDLSLLPQNSPNDDDDEEEVEIDSCVVKLSDVCKEVKQSDLKPVIVPEEEEEEEEEEYDVEMDDVEGFVKRMFGLDKLAQRLSLPSVGSRNLPALPAPVNHASSVQSPSSVCSSNEECMPPLGSHTRTPEVLWHQDFSTIGIKIKLTGVQQYYLQWSLNHFRFRTEVNDEIYETGDELFGPMIPEALSHSAKGLYVHIKIKKAVCGFMWSRLFNCKSRKLWLKYDLDMYRDDLQTPTNRKLTGITRREREESAIIPEIADTDEEDNDDEEYDALDNMDAPYDPLDPLN